MWLSYIQTDLSRKVILLLLYRGLNIPSCNELHSACVWVFYPLEGTNSLSEHPVWPKMHKDVMLGENPFKFSRFGELFLMSFCSLFFYSHGNIFGPVM